MDLLVNILHGSVDFRVGQDVALTIATVETMFTMVHIARRACELRNLGQSTPQLKEHERTHCCLPVPHFL